MNNILIKLKRILNSIPNEELEKYDLTIDCSEEIKMIAIEDEAIVFVTDTSKLKIDGLEW